MIETLWYLWALALAGLITLAVIIRILALTWDIIRMKRLTKWIDMYADWHKRNPKPKGPNDG